MCVGSVVSTGERQQAMFGRLYVTPKVLFLELLSLILLGYCRNAGCLYSRGTRFEKKKNTSQYTWYTWTSFEQSTTKTTKNTVLENSSNNKMLKAMTGPHTLLLSHLIMYAKKRN